MKKHNIENTINGLEKVKEYIRTNNGTALQILRMMDRVEDTIKLLKAQEDIVRCRECKWYDERISLCDNCGLPREQTFFCADGKRRDDDA